MDGQTDRQNYNQQDRASIAALHGKNTQKTQSKDDSKTADITKDNVSIAAHCQWSLQLSMLFLKKQNSELTVIRGRVIYLQILGPLISLSLQIFQDT